MKTIEFYYADAHGLESYHIETKVMPDCNAAYEIIMQRCEEHNIEPYFALTHTTWFQQGHAHTSFRLPKRFIESKTDETAKRYAGQVEKFSRKSKQS